ncbi:hypothetical protein Tco_1112622 [Tanacetum coccineum]|uniref:Uncharacterized protein n=1 Tax=Tanacetum coccineum TaxID=301880 RepID=A0ABQ5IQ46_9ASTR
MKDDKGKRVMESNSGAVKKRKKSDIIGADKEKGESSKASTSKPKKGKGKKPYVFQTRTTPKPLYNAIVTLKPISIAMLAQNGLEIYTSIVITQQLIGEMLGIKNEGVDLMEEVNANDDEMVKDWDSQFKKGKEITPSYLKSLIRKSKVADMNFKLNFIVMFTSMLYVDGTVCNEFNVGRKRPPTSFWTMELLKEREYEEINAGGIGKGALQGPFVEEDDPMPEDEDHFGCNYPRSLHYKTVGNEGNSCSDLNGDNNDEPQQVNTLQEPVDNNSKDYDSPTFAMGPATQKEVFTRVDKTPVTDRNTSALSSANQSEPINAVSLSMCKPVLKDEDVVHGRGKRKYTKRKRVSYTRGFSNWQTDKRPNDSGVFLMRHMEAYMGTIISKWACGLETEGRKQNTMLGRLRKRYAATLLLSKFNMHSYIVRAQLEGIQVAEGPVKRMKLPARGK